MYCFEWIWVEVHYKSHEPVFISHEKIDVLIGLARKTRCIDWVHWV